MDWMINIIIPSITLIVYFFIFGGLFFITGRFFYRYWNQKLKFFIKYLVLRTAYNELMVMECKDAIDKKYDLIKFKMHLLMHDYSISDIYEIIYVFKKIRKILGIKDDMKGGFKRK